MNRNKPNKRVLLKQLFFIRKVEIFHAKSLKSIATVEAQGSSTVLDVKKLIYKQKSKLYPDRQMLKFESAGKPLKDEEVLTNLKGKDSNSNSIKLYLKDLGPQVGWTTVISSLLSNLFVFHFHKALPILRYS